MTPNNIIKNKEVVDLVLNRDRAALEVWANSLVKETLPKLTKIIGKNFQYSNPKLVAEDVFQDCFVLLMEAIEKGNYNPEKAAVSGYFQGIIRKRLLNYGKKQDTKNRSRSEEVAEELEEIRREKLMDLVEKYFPKLNMESQKILREKYKHGRTLKEIANEIEKPYVNVRKQSERCLRKLKALIIADPLYKELFE